MQLIGLREYGELHMKTPFQLKANHITNPANVRIPPFTPRCAQLSMNNFSLQLHDKALIFRGGNPLWFTKSFNENSDEPGLQIRVHRFDSGTHLQ